MITVYYDGKCGLCSKEIRYYQRIAEEGIFAWQDITLSTDALYAQGITLSEGLRFLHAQDNDGNIHIGVDAFILIWKQIKYWRWLAAFISLPIIYQMAGLCYRAFAAWRFKRLAHCQLSLHQEKSK